MGSKTIAVVGGGAWGSALAVHFARRGYGVRLWVRESELVPRLRAERENAVFLPGVGFPTNLEPVASLEECVRGEQHVLTVVPSAFARPIYRELAAVLDAGTALVVCTKGIERGTLALPLDVAAAELDRRHPLAIVSGPSFAAELAHDHPTAVVVASSTPGLARSMQDHLGSPRFRLYTSDDPIGVQVAGALKNVIAIATGVADSLGMGQNARAALITRGLAEITRLGEAMGGLARTFSGLAGLGDLVLTCTGDLSRNRRLGRRLGRGEALDAILSSTPAVAEGVETTRGARALARRHRVEMPIVEELHGLLFEGTSVQTALERLLCRPLTAEHREETGGT